MRARTSPSRGRSLAYRPQWRALAKVDPRDRVQLVITAYQAGLLDT
jgi:hypothetical protein